MDVNDIIMDFIFQNGFEPSAKLKLHYSQSEVTKKLNEFPSYDILNEAFKGEMDEESYEILKKRIINNPSITFFLNPDPSIPITTKIHGDKFMVGYFKSGTVRKFKRITQKFDLTNFIFSFFCILDLLFKYFLSKVQFFAYCSLLFFH